MTDPQDSTRYPDRTRTEDEWLWLEDIYGEKPLAWVAEQNDRTLAELDAGSMARLRRETLDILDATDRIPLVTRHGDFLYNFWRDEQHPKGLWRRTVLDSYRTAEAEWDILLDVDALAAAEGTEWVFAGAAMLFPDYTRALVKLSPDGGDAYTVREFSLPDRAFIDDGFVLPSAKTGIDWIDQDTVIVTSDFGPGTLTTSSYPRQVRRWQRGQPIADAEILLEIPADHMGVWAGHYHTLGYERTIIIQRIDFYRLKTWVFDTSGLVEIDVPEEAEVDFHRQWMTIRLRSDWEVDGQTWSSGTLLVTEATAYLAGERNLVAVFTPDAHSSLVSSSWTRNYLMLNTLHDVASRVEVLSPTESGWQRSEPVPTTPNTTIQVSAVDADSGDDYWLVTSGFLQPTTLYLGTVGSDAIETLKSAPAYFDAEKLTVEQHFAISKDGTRVPYFQIGPANLKLNGTTPTLLYGYGGFEISLTPGYDGTAGPLWLNDCFVKVVANIRGGGEYGPAWHKSALRENRHRAYEDFAAVAQDLIQRGVTSPEHLGCIGGSNGGLLVGNMLTHYPDLFGAIVCQVPLLDMQRYTKLSAGFSWIAEYGDPDQPADWAFIQTFSPYHNLRENTPYPPVLFYTATSDDRVGPVQARKLAARMLERGIPDVLFYENRAGGHGGAADNAQRADMLAMGYEFLREHLS
jgi:prolyl oligopeptidase